MWLEKSSFRWNVKAYIQLKINVKAYIQLKINVKAYIQLKINVKAYIQLKIKLVFSANFKRVIFLWYPVCLLTHWTLKGNNLVHLVYFPLILIEALTALVGGLSMSVGWDNSPEPGIYIVPFKLWTLSK